MNRPPPRLARPGHLPSRSPAMTASPSSTMRSTPSRGRALRLHTLASLIARGSSSSQGRPRLPRPGFIASNLPGWWASCCLESGCSLTLTGNARGP
jgi:hypothetical protein